ncbi:hypothetical protein SDC9_164232 [bioreactor metagenome]|uniref:Uncharacterized protein n=1 Tax=bioreactor metagenome TaxID=1076179 RepID=A0A645FR30_9ZZZZ
MASGAAHLNFRGAGHWADDFAARRAQGAQRLYHGLRAADGGAFLCRHHCGGTGGHGSGLYAGAVFQRVLHFFTN